MKDNTRSPSTFDQEDLLIKMQKHIKQQDKMFWRFINKIKHYRYRIFKAIRVCSYKKNIPSIVNGLKIYLGGNYNKEYLNFIDIMFASHLLHYLKNINENDWCTDVCGKGENQKCFIGHVSDFGWKSKNKKVCEWAWDYFENTFAPTTQIYLVNDGERIEYPQATPKQRGIVYLENLITGKELTTYEQMELDSKASLDLK